jgi:hypothetical protein
MYLLEECPEFHDIISWSYDGHSFVIYKPQLFEDKVLPVIFKEARYRSFHRKVSKE